MLQVLIDSPLASTALLGIGGAVGALVVHLMRGRIDHQFNKSIENLRAENARKDRASQLAEYLAWAWRLQSMNDISKEEAERGNRMAFNLSLWLPSEVVAEIAKCQMPDGNFWDALFVAREWVTPDDPLIKEFLIAHDTRSNAIRRRTYLKATEQNDPFEETTSNPHPFPRENPSS